MAPTGVKSGHQIPWLRLLGLQWVLRTESGSLVRASSAFQHRAISPALQMPNSYLGSSANPTQQTHSTGIPLFLFSDSYPYPARTGRLQLSHLKCRNINAQGGREPPACCESLLLNFPYFLKFKKLNPGDLHTPGKSSADKLFLQWLLDLKTGASNGAASKDTCHTQPESGL